MFNFWGPTCSLKPQRPNQNSQGIRAQVATDDQRMVAMMSLCKQVIKALNHSINLRKFIALQLIDSNVWKCKDGTGVISYGSNCCTHIRFRKYKGNIFYYHLWSCIVKIFPVYENTFVVCWIPSQAKAEKNKRSLQGRLPTLTQVSYFWHEGGSPSHLARKPVPLQSGQQTEPCMKTKSSLLTWYSAARCEGSQICYILLPSPHKLHR